MSQANNLHHFHATKDSYDVTLDLTMLPEDQVLKIRQEHEKVLRIYSALIDQAYIESNKDYNCFTGASDIYEFISSNFAEVTVEEGKLSFLYRWGTTVPKTRQVTIILIEQGKDTVESAHKRIDELHEELHCTEHKLEQTIAQLQAMLKRVEALESK